MKRLFMVAVVTVAALGQNPGPPLPLISAYYTLDNGKTAPYKWLAIDPPMGIKVDATGRPHLTSPLQPLPLSFGPGFITITGSDQHVEFDPAYMGHRTDPPTQSGPCMSPIANQPVGSGAWAAAGGYFYFCVNQPSADPADQTPHFIWARIPYQTSW